MRKTNENNKQSSQKSKECGGKQSGKSAKNCK